jgi:hypothetical protein
VRDRRGEGVDRGQRAARLRDRTWRGDASGVLADRRVAPLRMELVAPPTQTPPVRYLRIECGWLGIPTITRETTAAAFRFPL